MERNLYRSILEFVSMSHGTRSIQVWLESNPTAVFSHEVDRIKPTQYLTRAVTMFNPVDLFVFSELRCCVMVKLLNRCCGFQIAQGLDKHRSDHSLLIYNVYQKAEHPNSPITRPAFESGTTCTFKPIQKSPIISLLLSCSFW